MREFHLPAMPDYQADQVSGAYQAPSISVSVVICTRLRPIALRECLLALSVMKRQPDELIVVDNSGGDPETERLAREFCANYLTEPIEGLSRARNRGLAASKGQIVAYLDDDALPDENWLDYLIEPFSDPRVAVVTGAVIAPESMIQYPQLSQPSLLDKSDSHWFEIAAFGGLGIGTNMAFRKSACEVRDFFDERMGRGAPFHGFEEHHAFVQLLSRDNCAVYLPTAMVHHSLKYPIDWKREASTSFAFSMVLFSEFRDNRADLLRFLFRRLRRKPLMWLRASPDRGMIVSSSWWVLLKAGWFGVLLYLKTRTKRKRIG